MSFAYVGSRTTRERNARGEGISVFRVEPATGALERVQLMGGLVNPSYLALNAAGDRLYTVHGDGSEVSAFAVDRATGELAFLDRASCEGRNPVHLALDPAGRALLVSNHLSGTVAAIEVLEDGRLGAIAQQVALPGEPGPHRKEQPFSKPHFNPFDPSGQWVLVPDKGLDRVFVFRCTQGRLAPAPTPWVQLPECAGPRNLVFAPSGRHAYVVNELDSTVVACAFDPADGSLRPLQRLSTLPDDFIGFSRAAGIQVDAAGQHLYVSNRGHDSIALFALEDGGRMRFVEAVPSQGRTPRFFTLGPGGRWMYVLNEDSDSIVRFSRDPVEGRLRPAGEAVACGSPVCMVFGGGV